MFNFGPRLELGSENGRGAVISNIAIILVGFGLIFLGYNTYTGQNQALENPVNVSATVTETGIDRQSSRRGGPDYQPEIIFEYSYGGQEYTSSNMYPGGQDPKDYNVESNAREVVQEYSQGSEISVSVPASVEGTGRSVSVNALTAVMGWTFSDPIIAGFGIGIRIFSMVFLPAAAVGRGVESMTGQNLGAKNFDRAGETAREGAKYSFLILTGLGVLVFLSADQIASIFIDSSKENSELIASTDLRVFEIRGYLVGASE
ncbi:MATE efflux family protein [Candidatus Haloredivivus sp. G17]|nr:MATE efflux family protein [Candidatus Haloredivivus sp. G17]